MKHHYNLLVKEAKRLGYKVIETNCDSWDSHTKTICNNKRRTLEHRVIYMIHEIGHAYHYENNKDTYFTIYPGFCSDGVSRKVSEIEQEALAWHVGLSVSKSIGVLVDEKKYAQIKTKCMLSYL